MKISEEDIYILPDCVCGHTEEDHWYDGICHVYDCACKAYKPGSSDESMELVSVKARDIKTKARRREEDE